MLTRDQIRAWADRVDWRHTRVVVVVAPADAEHVETLRAYRPDLAVLLFDWGAARSQVDGRAAIVGRSIDLWQGLVEGYRSTDRVEVIGDPAAPQSARDEAQQVVDRAVTYATVQEFTTRDQGKRWTRIGLDSIHRMVDQPLAQCLPQTWAGRPAIIVGAGPSLALAGALLRRAQGRALIVAAASAAGALARLEVVPDAWVCAEAHPAGHADLTAHATRGTVLVQGMHTDPGFLDLEAAGRVVVVQGAAGLGAYLARQMDLPAIATGSSVTTLAYGVAERLGADPIILVGQDCALPGGRMYAEGRDPAHCASVAETIEGWRSIGITERVPAWGGVGEVETTTALSVFRQWFEMQAAREGGPRVINASIGGAQIAGTVERDPDEVELATPEEPPHQALASALAECRRLDRAATIAALRRSIDDTDGRARAAADVVSHFRSASEAMDRIVALTEAGSEGIGTSYWACPLDVVYQAPSRASLEALCRIAQEVVDHGPDLIERCRAAIERLEGSHD